MKVPLSNGCLRCFYTRLILLPASLFFLFFPIKCFIPFNLILPSHDTSFSLDPEQPSGTWKVSFKRLRWAFKCLLTSMLPLDEILVLMHALFSVCLPAFFTTCAPRDFQAAFRSECTVPEKHWILASHPVRSEGSSNLSRDLQTITKCILTEAQTPVMWC